MKSTGIVRRIDDLGRIVIPKEVRRSMNIKEGDPLELYIDGKFVCLKKYSIQRNWELAHQVANVMFLNDFLPNEIHFALYDENFERKATTSDLFETDGSKIESDFIHKIADIGWIAVDFDDRTQVVENVANVLSEILAEKE